MNHPESPDGVSLFPKILIANRGEIVCRIARTARRLGIATVAVYSDADAGAHHVEVCEEAVRIGPPPARESYLNATAIIDAARRTDAVAVHPGYGFLSENAEFAVACAAAGLVFIGPPPGAIRSMGSKIGAHALMACAGVPCVPGFHDPGADASTLAREAARIGYPVLIKASAGGGGKGMRRVDAPADLGDALAACRREALASFGDDSVLLERYIEQPRHIEIQIFSDQQGHCIGLHERDCSVQRRYQKVIEEAPAPGLQPGQRAQMVAAAVAAAKAVGYVGAGTVEFIVDPEGHFHFMEMNTRLQVEHPITEMITGLDLVEWQLRIAAGEPLPLAQEEVPLNGHAIEARIYAEDPARGFLPAAGHLAFLVTPDESPQLRIDTGIREGDEITAWYDPMIAKLIVWGETRDLAVTRLARALRSWHIAGIANNVDYLARLVASPAYRRGEIDTGLIEREQSLLAPVESPSPESWALAALALIEARRATARECAVRTANAHSPWNEVSGWRLNAPAEHQVRLRYGTTERTMRAVAVAGAAEPGTWTLHLDSSAILVHATPGSRGRFRATLDGHRVEATALVSTESIDLYFDGRHHVFGRGDLLPDTVIDAAATGGLVAPMPGRVTAVLAQAGAVVARGAPLVIIEAMKMEHTIAAPTAGTVLAIDCTVGDQVHEGVRLVDFKADAGSPGR